jgi:hypothetical protein
VFLAGQFVIVSFVFIHIPGGSFIFNIFKGQCPISNPEKHIREPPQWAQAGIFHPLHEHRFFVQVSHQQSAISVQPQQSQIVHRQFWHLTPDTWHLPVLRVSTPT